MYQTMSDTDLQVYSLCRALYLSSICSMVLIISTVAESFRRIMLPPWDLPPPEQVRFSYFWIKCVNGDVYAVMCDVCSDVCSDV